MKTFQEFGLPPLLNEALERMEYTEPTPIQAQTIPLALAGRDILGSAQTGTGKTAAFMLPLIAQLLKDTQKTALVLAPTRELAAQVVVFTQKLLGRKSLIDTALLIGGEPMYPQLSMLRKNPRIVIGTPGRVNDHLTRGTLSLSKTGIFVLDEADRMLDMGFGIQIDAIAEHLPAERQAFLFSATLPAAIIRLTQKYLTNPEQVNINATHAPAANIQQDTINVTPESKLPELLKELEKRSGSVIIFVKTKFGAERLSRSLRDEGHSTDFLHGDLRQNRRNKVIKDFRESKHRIMIATDVAARGLDIPHIEHVINYDLPQSPEDYVHRIGRTARAGRKGFALCLIAPQDRRLWAAIQYMLDPKKNQKPAPERSFGGRRGGNGGGSRGGRPSFFSRDRESNGGGFNRDRSPSTERSTGGFSRDRDNNGGGFNRDRSPSSERSSGGFNRDRSPSAERSTGGFSRDRDNNGGGFNRDRSPSSERGSGGFNRDRSPSAERSTGGFSRPSNTGERSSGGFSRDRDSNQGGFSRDRDNNGGGFNRDRSHAGSSERSTGGFRDRDRSSSQGGFSRDRNSSSSKSYARPQSSDTEKNRP